MIGQAAACNPEEQEEVADGMALKLNTFVYLAHRNWRYVDAERENRSASCSDKARFRDERMAHWSTQVKASRMLCEDTGPKEAR